MAASIIVTPLTDLRQSLKGFTVQDLPDHSKAKQFFPGTIMFAWKSSYGSGSSIDASFELNQAETKAYICSFGRTYPSSLPSSEVSSEE